MVCSASGAQGAPAIAVVDSGACITAWEDARAVPDCDLSISCAYAVDAQRSTFDLSPPTAVGEEPPSALRLVLDSPNPSSSGLRLTYGVPSAEAGQSFECALFDVSGRKLLTLANGPAMPGYHSLSMDRSGVVGGLRAGHYYVRLVVGRHRLTTPVILLR